MKQKIKEFLNSITHTEGRYTGGGDNPHIIVFDDSEECDKDFFIDDIASQIEELLSKEK